jgi:hypothetical protein
MNRLDLHPPSLIAPVDAQSDAPARPSTPDNARGPARRLIVLVPADSDYTAATRRIWELAHVQCAGVQFLSLCQDPAQELGLRRQLVTLSALVGDAKVSTEAKVEFGRNWVDIVRRNYQAGDMIVCFAEHRAGLFHRPLSQVLESSLSAPVYILPALAPRHTFRTNWLAQGMGWAGSFGIMAGFFWLQVEISQFPQDAAQTVLLILSVAVEIWLIWLWNSLFT